MKKNIALLGATGTIGQPLVRQLLAHGHKVKALVHRSDLQYSHKNLHSVPADEVTQQSLQDVDALFLLVATTPNQVDIETHWIHLAKKAGIKRIVKLSAPLVKGVNVAYSHRLIEQALEQSGLEHVNICPESFMQNLQRGALAAPVWFTACPTSARAYVHANDVAEVAAKLLTIEHLPNMRHIVLRGKESASAIKIAEHFHRLGGSKVDVVKLETPELFTHLTTHASMPKWLAEHVIELDGLAQNDPHSSDLSVQDDHLEQWLTKPQITLAEYLTELSNEFNLRIN